MFLMFRGVVLSLALTSLVRSQGSDFQSQYGSPQLGGFVPIAVPDSFSQQQTSSLDQAAGFTSSPSFPNSASSQSQTPPDFQDQSTFQDQATFQDQPDVQDESQNDYVDDNSVDNFVASIPAPQSTPSTTNFISSINNNNNFLSPNNNNFVNDNNPSPFASNDNIIPNNNFQSNTNNFISNNPQVTTNNNIVPNNNFQSNTNSFINNNNNNPQVTNNNNIPQVITNSDNNNNPQVITNNNNNLPIASNTFSNSDSVNFPAPTTPLTVVNQNNNNFVNNPVSTSTPVANAPALTRPPVTNTPVPTRAPVVITNPPATAPPVIQTVATAPTPAQSRQQQCYIRSCDQKITGRNMEYDRALAVVQNEEYLQAADLSVIRRRKRHLWSKPEISEFEKQETDLEGRLLLEPFNTVAKQSSDENLIFSPLHSIVKRSSDYCFSQGSNSTACFPIASGALTAGLMALLFVGAKLQSGIFGGNKNSAPLQRPVQIPSVIVMPPLGQAPANSPQPGQPGGGELPVTNPFAAALAPERTVPVAVFPPYNSPRTYPSACVTFSERTQYDPLPKPVYNAPKPSYSSYSNYLRKKRSPFFPWRLGRNRTPFFGRNWRTSKADSYGPPGPQTIYRKFGFSCQVTLVNTRCQLGITCDENGNKLSGFRNRNDDVILRRQTGEDFASDAPPDCRTQLAPNGCN